MQKFGIKNYRAEIITFYSLAACALIVAAFFDLKIDISLNNTSSFVANWFAQTGEIPSSLLLVTATAVLAKCSEAKWLKCVGAVGCLVSGGYLGDYVQRRLFADTEFSFGFGIIYGIGVALLFMLAFHFIPIPENIHRPLVIISLIALAGTGVAAAMVSGMKALWGRVRFRDLDSSYSQFTAWYVINGNNGSHSFPSGHTNSAGAAYFAMFLPFVSENARRHYRLCFWSAFAFASTVAATRLVMGAHYLSDVTVGGTIAFSCMLIGMAVFEKISSR